MVLTGTFSLTNWINSRPFTGRPVSVRRNVRAYPTVITAIGSPDNSFPGSEGGGDESNNNFEKSSSSSWRGTFFSWSIPTRNWPLILKTVAFHTTHIAARLISQPFQPALEKIQQRAANSAAVKSACAAFQVDDLASLHDVANSLVLSECVYKVVGRPEQEAVRIMSSLKSLFPPGIVTISSVQFARSHVTHRFAISQSDDAMYVAFMGTKLPRDFMANVQAWDEAVQFDADTVVKSNDAEKMTTTTSDTSNTATTANSTTSSQQAPAAHRGFLTRAKSIPIDTLFAEAQKKGKRLVLCGHSLGGAVATLTAISLLQRLPAEQHAAVSCVGFATPALGNRALNNLVKEHKWDSRIINYLVPEDPIPRLLSVNSSSQRNGSGAGGSEEKGDNDSGSGDGSGETTENLPSQFDVVGNIAAVPGRLFSLSRRSASKQEQESTAQLATVAAAVATAVAGSTTTTTTATTTTDSNTNTTTSSPLPTTPGGGLRRTISQGTIKMVNIATAPLRRPIYQTIGRQLYICEDAVKTERPIGTSNNSRTGSGGNSSTSSGTTRVERSTTPTPRTTSTQSIFKLPFASAFLPSTEGEGDDDNVDIAAATAAAEGTIPDRLPRRTLFPMHRMLTHRQRLLSICQDALSGHRWPGHSLVPGSSNTLLSYSLPHVPNFHPDDIVLSELLAPAMFPLKAEAAVPSAAMLTSAAVPTHTVGTSSSSSPVTRVSLMAATRQKLTRPFRTLLNRTPLKGDGKSDSAPLDVIVRIEGRGLCNVTNAWVSGGRVDAASGKSTPIEAEIISIPRAPSPAQVAVAGNSSSSTKTSLKSTSSSTSIGSGRKPINVLEPVSALASWVAMAVGWQSLLRQLQKPSQSDYLLAKVKLPVSTVRAAHKARDPFSVAVGEVPKLMLHLQSDFAVHSLPLQVVADEGGSDGGGGRNNNKNASTEVHARYKDANQFLRNVKPRLPHL